MRDIVIKAAIANLKGAGFLTGSVKFGCDNPQDEDWVVQRKDWEKLIGHQCTDYGFYYEQEDYTEGDFQSFKINYKGKIYNFIVTWTKKEYHAWLRTTKLMMRLPKRLYRNKEQRIELFESLKIIVIKDMETWKWVKPHSVGDDIPF